MAIRINKDIPRTMTMAGLEYLGRLSKCVPENGTIVEIGPLFGSSTWVLAKNAHPSVKVISVDTWEPQPWIDKIEAKFPGCKPFSIEAFKYYTQDCENVTAVQGWSPDIVKDMALKNIDLFFDDATHGDPGFSDNMNYFIPRVRPGGIICGDDFASGWPDIIRNVIKISSGFGVEPEICGRVWAISKPRNNKEKSNPVSVLLEDDGAPKLTVKVFGETGSQVASPDCWAGIPHIENSLKQFSVSVQQATSSEPLYISYKAIFLDGTETHWCFNGEILPNPQQKRLKGIASILSGPGAANVGIEYQINSFNVLTGETKNSKTKSDGRLLVAEENFGISSLRFSLRTAA